MGSSPWGRLWKILPAGPHTQASFPPHWPPAWKLDTPTYCRGPGVACVCMLRLHPPCWPPSSHLGCCREGVQAADKGCCGPPGQAGLVGSWGRMATTCHCTERPLHISAGQRRVDPGQAASPPPHQFKAGPLPRMACPVPVLRIHLRTGGTGEGTPTWEQTRRGSRKPGITQISGWPTGPASTVRDRKSEAVGSSGCPVC